MENGLQLFKKNMSENKKKKREYLVAISSTFLILLQQHHDHQKLHLNVEELQSKPQIYIQNRHLWMIRIKAWTNIQELQKVWSNTLQLHKSINIHCIFTEELQPHIYQRVMSIQDFNC
ncbi:hypothetical protein AMTRI_Chr13g90920 [Amborella trichopoda]